jgi:hypothetical protein
MQAQEKPSLYDRLGGVYNIATVVDDLIDRVMVDARLNANPRVDEAHHRVSPAGFKYLSPKWFVGQRADRNSIQAALWVIHIGIS